VVARLPSHTLITRLLSLDEAEQFLWLLWPNLCPLRFTGLIFILTDMDPVTALGVASSVVQLVDFTQGLIRSTYEIYKSTSGSSAANVDLQTVTTSLKSLNDDLRLSVDRGARALGKGTEPSNNDAELLTLCQNCNGVADNLISTLEKLKAQKSHKIRDNFGRALLTVWTKKEVESLERQLEQYRHQISLHINASVR